MSIEFLITTLVIVASPGTGALFAIGASCGDEVRAVVIVGRPVSCHR